MTIVLGLALGLIIGGLVILWLSGQAHYAVLVTVLFWVGIVLTIVGLVLLVTPVLNWVYAQLRIMLGT